MSKKFYFGSPSDSDDDPDALPYPEPLPRNSFLTPDFTPTGFLSSLHNRHQTLEDLRSELRTRSQELSKELLDLVNDNYQEFLGLGDDLRGGDDKVEEIRVGLTGFKREIDSLKEKTETRRTEAEALVTEHRDITREIRIGKDLLEINTRLEELEEALEIKQKAPVESQRQDNLTLDLDLSDESDESEEDSQGTAIPLSRLKRRIDQFHEVGRLARRAGTEHPFVIGQKTRIDKVKQTLLLDLNTALRQCGRVGAQVKALKLLKCYDMLEEPQEAIKTLQTGR